MKNNLKIQKNSRMIISKTPYRISFLGGGSDYPDWYVKNGGLVLSTTIDKYIYISCRYLPPFFKHKYRIVWSKLEHVKKICNIKHNAVREMLKYFEIKNGLEIHYDGDLPARSGMGSSSVFVVGLMNLLNNFQGKIIGKKALAQKSIHFEQKILKEVVGSQDQIAACYGGFNKIVFNIGGGFSVNPIIIKKKILEKFNKNLLLIYTGISRTAHTIAKSYTKKLQRSKKADIIDIINLTNEGEKFLKQGNLNDFGKLLHESWLLKKSLGSSISNHYIDDIYNNAVKKGALGGKLLGAGGGGFLLFYVPYFKQKSFIKFFKKLIPVHFKFTSEGSKILFTTKNKE
jgi:D-glycero-alpha-D-manno-heptose-7-phosphate kinase